MLVKPEYFAPDSLAKACEMIAAGDEGTRIIAGGTDLIPRMRSGTMSPERLVDLRLLGLDGIEQLGNILRVGASATHAEIEKSALLAEFFPALPEAARQIAGPPVRNRGTIGGNLVNASPAADFAPPLLVYEAVVVLVKSGGQRMVPLDQFFTGPGSTVMAADELLTEVQIPMAEKNTAASFLKVGKRKAMAISVVNLATRLTLDEDGKIIKARIALGSVAPTPIRAHKAESVLEGEYPDPKLFDEAGQAASTDASPIDDIRASAEYRKKLVGVLTRRGLVETFSRLKGLSE